MSTNFPGALDNSTSLPYPGATDDTNSPSLAGGQDNQNDAVIAAQAKLGIGASNQSPTAGKVLIATGTGQSEWSTLSGSQTSGSTGTGDFVLANSPTISSPTIANPSISNPTFSGSLGSISTGSITATGLITGNAGLTMFSGAMTLNSGTTFSAPAGSISSAAMNGPYKFLATAGSGQSFTGDTTVKVQCGTVVFNTGSAYDSVTNYRFTAAASGYYSFSGYITITLATNNDFSCFMIFSTGFTWAGSYLYNGIGSSQTVVSACNTPLIHMNVNDYVEFYASATSTSTAIKAGFGGYLWGSA